MSQIRFLSLMATLHHEEHIYIAQTLILILIQTLNPDATVPIFWDRYLYLNWDPSPCLVM